MRLPLVLVVPVLLIALLLDVYIYRAIKRRCLCHPKLWRGVALWSAVVCEGALILLVVWPKKAGDNGELLGLMWGLYAFLTVYVAKLIFVIVDLLACLPCLIGHHRFKWQSRLGIVAAVAVFAAMWWGALVNRYNIDVVDVEIERADLPEGFDGLRIVQFSDLHVGSFGADTTFVAKLVDSINAQAPDVVLFTGDIVNRRSDELEPFVATLARIEAPVYTIRGNHDYGDYYLWPSPEAKAANMELLDSLNRAMGWHMLNNATAMLRRGSDTIALIGVENIGDPPFHVYGDLQQAYPRTDDGAFKILMSHNPAHWQSDIEDSPGQNIALTLAGHTHAMQCELFGASPAALRYKYWDGLHSDSAGRQLYVNIGAGEVGMPARIGATPELTVFTLKRKQ